MKYAGTLLALAGIALAIVLFAQQDLDAIGSLLIVAGPGLVLAALFHIVRLPVSASAWRILFPAAVRRSVASMTFVNWVRESVNTLLPVARVGGEVAAYRILRGMDMPGTVAASTLIADMTISLLSQSIFTLVGVALLITRASGSSLATTVAVTAALAIPLVVAFIFVQRAGALGALARFGDRLLRGRLGRIVGALEQVDEALLAIYRRPRALIACLFTQLAAWTLGAGEIWLALYFLGDRVSVLDAVIIEALIQAISSMAFIVPGALGVQEGAFLVLGNALGIDATTSLALATARRVRDAIMFFPGLLAWHRIEQRMRGAGDAQVRPSD
ncbi:MAG TPA: lysylphosphatidylglycerol synthase domain-containing protein [Casimicrobiaceae bacterium]|nr:lysylphosphatidylglycerol synthase domain-containing protein [Casimicrobiaceae bacterium]